MAFFLIECRAFCQNTTLSDGAVRWCDINALLIGWSANP